MEWETERTVVKGRVGAAVEGEVLMIDAGGLECCYCRDLSGGEILSRCRYVLPRILGEIPVPGPSVFCICDMC